jgi:hypothetical protein
MNIRLNLLFVAVIGSIVCWLFINFFIVALPLWKYLIIETLIVITKMIYEKEKMRITNK